MKYVILFVLLTCSLFSEENFLLLSQEALKKYQTGEQAQTVDERNKAFNQAIHLYSQIEKHFPSGELDYNLANSYFQLGEYEKALVYYARALHDLPRNTRLLTNFQIALDKIKNPESWNVQRWLKFFSGRTFLTDKELTIIFFCILGAVVLFWSLFIWLRKFLWRLLSILFTLLFLYILSLFICRIYLIYPEGVTMGVSMVYRDAGVHYGSITPAPLPSGTLIEIVEEFNHEWFKVKIPGGNIGYVLKKNLELI